MTLRVGSKNLGIRTTSAAFGGWLADVLANQLVDPSLDREAYSVVVGEPATVGRPVHVLYRGGSEISRDVDLARIASSLLAELDTYGLADRDDALYLAASLLKVDGRAVLGPAFLHPVLGRMGRRVARAKVDRAPAAAVAVDLDSGDVSTPRSDLSLPADAIDRLAHSLPQVAGRPDRWSEHPRRVEAVLLFGSDQGVPAPPTRAETLHGLAQQSLNLRRVGGRSVLALRPLVEGAVCRRSGWIGGDGWLGVLRDTVSGAVR